MFTTKIAMQPEEVNGDSKTAVMIGINDIRDIVMVDTIPDIGIVLYTMNKRGEVTKAAQYRHMMHVWLDCLPMLYIDGWQIQVDAWSNLFSNYLEPSTSDEVAGD